MMQTRTAYHLKAHYLETCNCDPGCTCNFGGFPNYGPCEAIVGMDIIEGNYGAVNMAGVRAVVAAKWPKAIHEGDGQSVLFVDESARPEQVEGLVSVLSGREGGMPWEILSSTITETEGPLLKHIDMKIDGRDSSFRIEGILEASLAPLRNPVTGEDNEVHVVFPGGGLIWDDGNACTTGTMRVDHGDIKFAYPGRSAFYTVVDWTNQN